MKNTLISNDILTETDVMTPFVVQLKFQESKDK